jgi:hypothetical protein
MSLNVSISGAFVDVVVTDTLTHADLDPLLDALAEMRARGPFVLLTDTTSMRSAPREVVMTFADRLKSMPPMKNVWLGDAVVIKSPLARFAVSTLVLVAPLPTDVKVFEARAQAELWCGDILRKHNVIVPAALMQRSAMPAMRR